MTTPYHDMGTPVQDISEPFLTPPASKKGRSPNALILFRSHVIANKFYPPDMKHQNDISRFVADMWRSTSASERASFFRKAEEEKLRYEIEGPVETQKKKRTRKPRLMKRNEKVPQLDRVPPQVPASPLSIYVSSPSSIEDNGSPVPVPCTPALNFYTPSRNASASPLRAPQSMPIHSPSLLGWDFQSDSHGSYSEERVFSTLEWTSPSHLSSFSSACNDVAAFDNALQLELDYLVSLDMAVSMPVDAYPGFTFPFGHTPSLKPLPYPFDSFDMPLAPF